MSPGAKADEGGVSFWLPGINGSLAATPLQPGFSLANIYYHTSVEGGGNVAFRLGGGVAIGIAGNADLYLIAPSYVFATPVLGGQAAFTVMGIVGRMDASASAVLTGPNGGVISGSRTDTIAGVGDLAPQFSLRWNAGVHNWMTYITADVPVGAYDSSRLANLGTGHWAVDGGGAYTYFNPQTGNEFSVTAGLTYNFLNPATQYRNGIDLHVDIGASRFLTKQWQFGVVGYAYQQLTGDGGAGATLGDFRSRVFGIGPQIGYVFPISNELQGYVNLKGYKEFAAENRPEGWNAWLTFAISPAAERPATTQRPMITK
jgi:hypothetical protein